MHVWVRSAHPTQAGSGRGRVINGAKMSRPAAGWYPDPGGSGGNRYWDGTRWTQALDTSAPPAPPQHAGQPPAGAFPAHGHPQRAGDGTSNRRGRAWVIAGVAVLAVAVAATVVYATMFQRGAATPIAAAEQLVAALNNDDVVGVLRLLPPDEVDAFRGLVDYVPEGQDTDGLLDGLRLEVVYGPSTQLAESVVAIPIEQITLEVERPGALGEALNLRYGERIVEDLRDEPYAAIVAVERRGSWFISPLGSVLELVSRESGFAGAGPAAPRVGAGSPQEAVQEAVQSLAREEPGRLLDLLDPEELQILDHYRPLLSQDRRPGTGSVRMDTDAQGAIVEVRRIEFDDGGLQVSLDLTTMCVEEPGYRECLRDYLDVDFDQTMPWELPALRALLEPQPAPLRIGTVTRDGRSYLSLAETISASVEPVLDRMGPHNLSGIARPDLSHNAVEVVGTPGEIIDLPLHDNWNAIRFAQGADLRACPPDARSSSEWQVEGAWVETERIGDHYGFGNREVSGVVVGVSANHTINAIRVRLASGDDRC